MLASPEGLEPPTCSLEDCHSIQLSYGDINLMAPLVGFEPTLNRLEGERLSLRLQRHAGDPYGIRTRISNVRGCRPEPLDEWAMLDTYIALFVD